MTALRPDPTRTPIGPTVLHEMTERPAPRNTDSRSTTNGTSTARTHPRDGVDRVEEDWRRERPDIDVSSFGVVTRIWRIARHLEKQRNQQLASHGNDRGTMDILAMLRRAGPPYRRSVGALTRNALITAGGVSQRLDKLERAGFITRHVDVEDRRRVDVELTADGVDFVDSVLTDLMDHDTRVLAEAFDEHDQETLRRLLRQLLLTLEPSDDA